MKIIHLIQKPQLRGAEIFACQLANHQQHQGHQVIMVTLFDEKCDLPFKGTVKCLQASINRRFLDIGGWKKLSEIIKDFAPDIIQANAADTLKYAVFSQQLFRWKAPIIFRNASIMSQYMRNKYIRIFNGFLLRRVRKVISVSAESAQDILSLYPFLREKVISIPIGVEKEEFHRKNTTQNYILHIGGFSFEKNHKGLLRIFKDVKEVHQDLELWLVGDGPLHKETQVYSHKLGLEKHVKFLGYRNDIPELMQGARLFVLPSVIEGLPAVILEAMQYKLPVIAYSTGGIPEVVSKETGWLIPKGDEQLFSETIIQILDLSQKEIKKVTDRAFQLISSNYNNESIAKKFLSVYTQVIHNGH